MTTLEDFFTLSELKDGLTAPERVNDLITIMHKEKDILVKNFLEATRQRSAVASTIAATENKNCLELFIDLDGLCFIDKWLNDAQNLGNDTPTDNFVEGSIIVLLRAVERLQIDSQRSSSSGIGRTVQNLIAHSSSVVREKAKMLCDAWMLIHDDKKAPEDVNNISPSNRNDNDENTSARSRDEVMETVTANQETIDPSHKTTHDDRHLLVKSEVPDSKSDVSELNKHTKDENEIDSQDKAELEEKFTLSSQLGELPSSGDANNVLESSMKTDPRVDKDEDMMDDSASGEAENPKSSSSSEGDREADNAKDGTQTNKSLRNGSPFFKLSISAHGDGLKSKVSDMELDYGMIDPLEVARQVAIEIEREVDSRERSCSTSEKDPSTPDSTNHKESPPAGGLDKEVSSEPKPSSELLPLEPVKDAETIVPEGASCKPDVTASQISEVAQESEANTGRGLSGFDLNQEVCSEEVDNPINNTVSSTISVVSASRANAAISSPAGPLQFEGTLGWKGSASTSAFRPVYNDSKPRLDLLDIDLNVAEDIEDKIDDFLSRNKTPIISSLPSGEESSVEASPMRPERMQLDLNSIGDDGVGFDWRRAINRNGWQSPSRSSSSSSKQPSGRKFDLNLNDQMVFPNGDHPYVSKLSKQSGAAPNQQQSFISIFGRKVEVQSEDSLPQPSGRIMPTMDFNLGKTGSGLGLGPPIQYANPSLYGHNNGFSPGAAMFFTTPMYGSAGVPIPYMVDSRGAPVVPQIMGSAATPMAQPAPPFVMNMAAAGPSSGSGGLDLNSGLMFDGGNRGLQQLFPQASSSSSVVGEKRHEPGGGWEFFPVNKHHQPQWR